MANTKVLIKDLAEMMGLKVGQKGSICYGNHSGYPFLLEEKRSNKQVDLLVQICATNMGQPMTYDMFQNLSLPVGVRMYVGNYRLNLGIDASASNEEVLGKLSSAIAMVTNVLKNLGFTGCDELGGVYNISLYSINGSYSFYSIDNVSYLQTRLAQVKEQEKAKKERVPLGILAAIGGGLAGAALILLIGKLGYISFYASILMSMFIVFLYKKAAAKFSVVSAIITGVLCLAFSIVIPRLSSALTIYDGFKSSGLSDYYTFTVGECFRYCKDVYREAGMTFYYYRDVVLMTVLGIGGGAAFIAASLKEVVNKDKVQKID